MALQTIQSKNLQHITISALTNLPDISTHPQLAFGNMIGETVRQRMAGPRSPVGPTLDLTLDSPEDHVRGGEDRELFGSPLTEFVAGTNGERARRFSQVFALRYAGLRGRGMDRCPLYCRAGLWGTLAMYSCAYQT